MENKRKMWKHLVGKSGSDAIEEIKKEHPTFHVFAIAEVFLLIKIAHFGAEFCAL
jgi:hypothetical protein